MFHSAKPKHEFRALPACSVVVRNHRKACQGPQVAVKLVIWCSKKCCVGERKVVKDGQNQCPKSEASSSGVLLPSAVHCSL